jgi:hypothetical protein
LHSGGSDAPAEGTEERQRCWLEGASTRSRCVALQEPIPLQLLWFSVAALGKDQDMGFTRGGLRRSALF